MVARFAREVEIHQKLRHPNIVEAVECVLGPNNICLFIMEVLEGMDLEEVLESQERIDDLNEFVSILHQICDGLEHAHKQGIIHRDLKPENIIVLKKGGSLHLKILDFGVAKIQEDLQKLTRNRRCSGIQPIWWNSAWASCRSDPTSIL
ncbi:MAG: protein kinase [Cyanobacteriota/Melainabacteria group bacterium]